MTKTSDVVFLFDVDNTLIDNDRVQADLSDHLEKTYGTTTRDRYWEIFEEPCNGRTAIANTAGMQGKVKASRRAATLTRRDSVIISLAEPSRSVAYAPWLGIRHAFRNFCSEHDLRCRPQRRR
jgi:hypothetical protein